MFLLTGIEGHSMCNRVGGEWEMVGPKGGLLPCCHFLNKQNASDECFSATANPSFGAEWAVHSHKATNQGG